MPTLYGICLFVKQNRPLNLPLTYVAFALISTIAAGHKSIRQIQRKRGMVEKCETWATARVRQAAQLALMSWARKREMKMYVNFKDLKPNPFRDYHVDPIDDNRVEMLAASIHEHGFWGGVVLRKNKDGELEIGAGHHRVAAAIKAGEKSADLFVGDFDDAAMAIVYATENATHRGGSGTAGAGSIAAAVRLLARGSIVCSQIHEQTPHTRNDQGIGETAVFGVLKGVPGMTASIVRQHLAAIKASGDYHRIVSEVAVEVEKAEKESLARAAKAKKNAEEAQRKADEAKRNADEAIAKKKEADAKFKAAKEEAAKKQAEANAKRAEQERQEAQYKKEAADKMKAEADAGLAKLVKTMTTAAAIDKAKEEGRLHVPTFDFEGVAAVLKNEAQLEAFRQVVTRPENLQLLAVTKQAAFAKKLAAHAKDEQDGLTAKFIREWGSQYISEMYMEVRKISAAEKAKTEKDNAEVYITNKLLEIQKHLNLAANSLFAAKQKAKEHGIKRYTFPVGFHAVLDDWIKEAQQMKNGIV